MAALLCLDVAILRGAVERELRLLRSNLSGMMRPVRLAGSDQSLSH
jgi:hypothetical protein